MTKIEKLNEMVKEARKNMDYVISGDNLINKEDLIWLQYVEESGLYFENKEKALQRRDEILKEEKEYKADFEIGEDVVEYFHKYENDDCTYFDGESSNEVDKDSNYICYINENLEVIDHDDSKEEGFKNDNYDIVGLDIDSFSVGRIIVNNSDYDIYVDADGNFYDENLNLDKTTEEKVIEILQLEDDEE